MWAKRCPKCGGDLFLREDLYVNEVICLQCGLVLSPEQEAELLEGSGQDQAPEEQLRPGEARTGV